jgi:hypothetical protein
MKLKKKPSKPERKTDIEEYLGSVNIDGQTLDSIKDYIRASIVQRFDLYFKNNYLSIDSYTSIRIKRNRYDDEYDDVEVHGIRDETDTEFNERMDLYLNRLAAYNKWYRRNKSAIDVEIQKRENKAKEKLAARQAKDIATLKNKLKKLKNG